MARGRDDEIVRSMATPELQRPSDERDQALRRVKKKRDLQSQLVSFVVINAALWAIWAAVGTAIRGRRGSPEPGRSACC
jgi:hypothetical protein